MVTYNDAVRVLGEDSKALVLIDKLSSITVILLGGLNLLEARAEIFKLSSTLIKAIDKRVQGLSRVDRTCLLEAAHTIIVVSSFFEALSELDLPIDPKDLRITSREQVAILASKQPSGNRTIDLVRTLFEASIPAPNPSVSFTDMLARLYDFYVKSGDSLCDFLKGLAAWDDLNERKRAEFISRVRVNLAKSALRHYEVSYRHLAIQCPEFYVWGRLYADAAMQQMIGKSRDALSSQIKELKEAFDSHGPALAGLDRFLSHYQGNNQSINEVKTILRNEYADFLNKGIVEARNLPPNLDVPTLGKAYISPPFKVREILAADDDPSRNSWWKPVQVMQDMDAYLSGYLSSSVATRAPLLVLGQPGSGKSILVRVLSAVLSLRNLFPIRVVLRDIGTEKDLLQQIEAGVSAAANSRIEWSEISSAASDIMPVVLLDGFDELLQATGVSQSDYLVNVAEFQRKEALKGRPLAFIVTSRTAVANRAQFPMETTAIHLEPFDEGQIRAWLEVWNATNHKYFQSNKIKELDPKIALAHRDLAEQPLLLLMLALYDLDGNRLSTRKQGLGRVELYEGLLQQFAEREVEKTLIGAPQNQISIKVERELVKLSIVAFAMFNRGTQWVNDADLDRDMLALEVDARVTEEAQMRARLTSAELEVGRFFFIYEARATQDNKPLQTYEFVHATFAEYLVARLAYGLLVEMTKRELAAEASFGSIPIDYGRVRAILSFAPLTTRGAVTDFLREIIEETAPNIRAALSASLKRLLCAAQFRTADSSYSAYEPRRATLTGRIAAYTANLVVLITIVDKELQVTDWWLSEELPRQVWRKLSTLWRAELKEDEWTNLVKTLSVRADVVNGVTEISLRIAEEESEKTHPSLWTIVDHKKMLVDGREVTVAESPSVTYDWVARESCFVCDIEESVIVHTIQPLADAIGPALTTFLPADFKELNSGGYLLLRAWSMAVSENRSARLKAYHDCMAVGEGAGDWSQADAGTYWSLLLGLISTDTEMPNELVREAVHKAWIFKADNRTVLRGALKCLDLPTRDTMDIAVAAVGKLDASDHVEALNAWLRLIEMGADGATMVRFKRFINEVPFLNQMISLEGIADEDPGLVRRAHWAMEHMNLADRVSWPEDC